MISHDHLSPETRHFLNAARLDPALFAQEQAALGRCWTFLGFEHQLRAENDWFTATLGGRSVFVQRFRQGIFGFLNRCAHRNYPLHTGTSGNGPVLCGFHHWRYNHEGVALGIPNCPDMFGQTPREMDAHLPRVEIAQAGQFIFGRFPEEGGPSLEAWLGPAFPILSHISGFMQHPTGRLECTVNSNWRALKEVSLDDYHIVAVHPATFGKAGYIPAQECYYERFGAHSCYFRGGNEQSLARMVQQCKDGAFFPERYRILQLFPSLVVTFVHALNYLGEGYWYVIVLQIMPEAPDRTRTLSRYFPIPHPPSGSALRRMLRALAWPSLNLAFNFHAGRVHREDNEACEQLQRIARADDPPPRLALHEKRIGWFEDSLARVLNGETPLP